jgi:hypothetical protein
MIMGYAAISTLITDMVIGVNVQLFNGSAGAQNEGVVADLTAGIFIFILLICISSFVLSVSIQSCLFSLINYFSFFAGDYRQTDIQISACH